MARPYEIWDWETANIVSTYPTLDEAFADVRAMVEANGRDAAASWLLQFDDRNEASIIADGDALIDCAFAAPVSVTE